MSRWRPDIQLDEDAVIDLVEQQFPDLHPRACGVAHVGSGWDNAVWLLGDDGAGGAPIAFRFVQRYDAVELCERELSLLGRLGPELPLAVPVPTHIGAPTRRHPLPWFGFTYHHGREVGCVELSAQQRAGIGDALGRFLRRLHHRNTLALVDPDGSLPYDANRRSDPATLAERVTTSLSELANAGFQLAESHRRVVTAIIEASARLTFDPAAAVLVHGDLHVRHLIVDDHGAASAVIDWGDCCRAPAGLDLTLYWSTLDAHGREHFRRAYGEVGDDDLTLGRACAIYLAAMIASSARDMGNESLALGAHHSLLRALS